MFGKRKEAPIEDPILDNLSATDLTELRRQVYDSQVKPALVARAAWLDYADKPSTIDGTVNTQLPNREGIVSSNLSRILVQLERDLSLILRRTEQGAHPQVLRLYQVDDFRGLDYDLKDLLPHKDYEMVDREIYDSAAGILMTELESSIPLRAIFPYLVIIDLLERNNKKAPGLPRKVDYTGNEMVSIHLPTKLPYLFATYRYPFGERTGLTRVAEYPKYVDLQAEDLKEYPSVRMSKNSFI